MFDQPEFANRDEPFPDEAARKARQASLHLMIDQYLGTFVEEGAGGGYPIVSRDDMSALYILFREIIDLKFARDADRDSVIDFVVADRKGFQLEYVMIPNEPASIYDPEADCVALDRWITEMSRGAVMVASINERIASRMRFFFEERGRREREKSDQAKKKDAVILRIATLFQDVRTMVYVDAAAAILDLAKDIPNEDRDVLLEPIHSYMRERHADVIREDRDALDLLMLNDNVANTDTFEGVIRPRLRDNAHVFGRQALAATNARFTYLSNVAFVARQAKRQEEWRTAVQKRSTPA